MPSAMETLNKVLKLERDQGFQNKAMSGGLGPYSAIWKTQAQTQARKPEHLMLIDELADLMVRYEQTEGRSERGELIRYMMDRLHNRLPPPEPYNQRRYELPADQPRSASLPNMPDADVSPSTARIKPRDPNRSRDRAGGKEREGASQRKREGRGAKTSQQLSEGNYATTLFERRDERSALNMERELEAANLSGVKTEVESLPRLERPPRSTRTAVDADAAADIFRGLRAPVERMSGIGPKMANLLNRLGIFTIEDMLFFRPRRYDDYTRMLPIRRLSENQSVTVIATIRDTRVEIGRNNRKDFVVVVNDGTGDMQVKFWGQHWLSRQLKLGQQVVLRGVTEIFRNRLQMSNPEWELLDPENLRSIGIVPIYPLTADLSARALRKLIKQVVEYWAERIPDPIPEVVLERCNLADVGWALRQLHNPEGWDHLFHAKRRLIFDQLLIMLLVMLENRRTWQQVPSRPILLSDEEMETFYSTVFPYPLTNAQRRAINDIRTDLSRDVPMNRLLQGDVGSGKTAVAISAIGVALLNKTQAALMAPTSILAEQHYQNISGLLAKIEPMLGYKPVIALLTSALSQSEREAIYRGLADGSIDVAIGTHALIQSGVEFHNLSLAIIDEQHRFGVEQRGTLRGKGRNPHLLVMTATPIPRTMALTMYADLDLSIIDEMPPGRTPIKTRIIGKNDRERLYQEVIAEELKLGRQAFIVYSLVEPSEGIDAESALEGYEKMRSIFHKYKVGLLHGKMKPSEKDEIMGAFRDHAFDILVTTSVAEVGVDVPNATVMVVEDANRFGLAQLHQFRGRVGRGQHTSYCFLVCESPVEEAKDRLRAMEQYSDGFKLAEIDWKLRGAGDLIGTQQSGNGIEALLEDMTPELVELAQHEARAIHAEDPDLALPEHRLIGQRVAVLRDSRSDVS
jgi:ATP-dependent DNA helicase RecG